MKLEYLDFYGYIFPIFFYRKFWLAGGWLLKMILLELKYVKLKAYNIQIISFV